MKPRSLCLLLWLSICAGAVYGQTAVRDIRSFNLMVIPYTTPDQRISEVLEKNADYRYAINSLQEVLTQNGFTVTDFMAKYQKFQQDIAMRGTVEDSKINFLDYAMPDVYVEMEVTEIKCENNTHKVRLTIKCCLTVVSKILATRTADSNCFVDATDVGQLTRHAARRILEAGLVNDLQSQLQQMVAEGQAIQVHVTIKEKAKFDFNTVFAEKDQVPSAPLEKMILMWMSQNPDLVLDVNPRGHIGKALVLDEVRIPLLDPVSKKFFPPNKFTLRLWRFLANMTAADASVKITNVSDEIINGTIYLKLE